jgi:hypothetical protein
MAPRAANEVTIIAVAVLLATRPARSLAISSGMKKEQRKALGLEFRIGRWTTPDMVKPHQEHLRGQWPHGVIGSNIKDLI